MIATMGSANIHHLIDIMKRKERRKNVFLLVKKELLGFTLLTSFLYIIQLC